MPTALAIHVSAIRMETRTFFLETRRRTCKLVTVAKSITASKKKCWIGSACIHGNVLECIIGKSFSEVLEKILIANENYATSMSSLLSV